MRPCAGNCGALDPSTDRCGERFSLEEDETLIATVTASPGQRCTIELQDSDDGHSRATCPRGTPDDSALQAGRLIGLSVEAAMDIADDHQCIVRVVRRNGRDLVVTQDFRGDRVNVAVEEGRITQVLGVN